jgi:hypothetical protein
MNSPNCPKPQPATSVPFLPPSRSPLFSSFIFFLAPPLSGGFLASLAQAPLLSSSLPESQSHFLSLPSSLPPSSLTPESLSWLARIFACLLACFSLLSVIPFLARLLFRPSPFSLLPPSPYHKFLTTATTFQHPLFVSSLPLSSS